MSDDDTIDVGEAVLIDNGDGFRLRPELALFDPDEVELAILPPTGPSFLATPITHDSTGKYHAEVQVDEAGTWRYRWDGDGIIRQGLFVVARRRVPAPGS